MTGRRFIALGAGLCAVGVAAGAFGAHGLVDLVTPRRLETFETAVRYHLIHAVALVVVGLLLEGVLAKSNHAHRAGFLFVAGIALFSGSLYVLVLTDTPWLGAVTPLGGVAFILGWLSLGWAAVRTPDPAAD